MTGYRRWAGSTGAYARLLAAVERNCTCERGEDGQVRVSCEAHRMMEDQRALNHLAFVAQQADRLIDEEHDHDHSHHRD